MMIYLRSTEDKNSKHKKSIYLSRHMEIDQVDFEMKQMLLDFKLFDFLYLKRDLRTQSRMDF